MIWYHDTVLRNKFHAPTSDAWLLSLSLYLSLCLIFAHTLTRPPAVVKHGVRIKGRVIHSTIILSSSFMHLMICITLEEENGRLALLANALNPFECVCGRECDSVLSQLEEFERITDTNT